MNWINRTGIFWRFITEWSVSSHSWYKHSFIRDRTVQNQNQYFWSHYEWIIRTTKYNFRWLAHFTTGSISTNNNGLKSLRNLGSKIWNITPPDITLSGNIEEFTRKIKCWPPKNVLIKSITLGMSISHMFGSSHSKVLWQIERVPILGADLTMAASALKCYSWLSFLCIFSYMLLKKMLKENMFYYCEINVFNPFRPQCTLSLPLKTSRFIFVYFIRIAANF